MARVLVKRHTVLLSLLYVFYVTTVEVKGATNLCRRLLLTGLKPDYHAYPQFNGIYEVLDNVMHDGFPVLKMANIFFAYNRTNNRFHFGDKLGDIYGLVVGVKPGFDTNTWLSYNHGNYPFAGVLDEFVEIIYTTGNVHVLQGKIHFKCIDDEYQVCDSGRLRLNRVIYLSGGKIINDPATDYYELNPMSIHNYRPVYPMRTSTSRKLTLYYHYTQWRVNSFFSYRDADLYVEDAALSPEFIMQSWKVKKNSFVSPSRYTSARVECIGVTSTYPGKSCNDSSAPCQNNGTCLRKPSGEELCMCQSGFYGVLCEKQKAKCPIPEQSIDDPTKIRWAIYKGLWAGSIATFFCHPNAKPEYFTAVCRQDSSNPLLGVWDFNPLKRCTPLPPTTTRRPTTTPRTTTTRWRHPTRQPEWEEPIWLNAVSLTLLCFSWFLGPLAIYMILKWRENKMDERQAKLKQQHYQHLEIKLNSEIRRIKALMLEANSDEDEIQQNLDKLHDDITKEREKLKAERQQIKACRKCKNVSAMRIYSLSWNIWIWLFIVYLIYYDVALKGVQSVTAFSVWMCTVIIMPISMLWVLIESLVSREFRYLTGLKQVQYAVQYLQELRNAAPHLIMTAECYHYETRTRTVYYTDANGNMQSRMETYQERVVTHSDSQLFRYGYWHDTSDERFAFSHDYGVTKIKLKHAIIPGDDKTKEKLNTAETEFQDRNRGYDQYMDYNLNIEVANFKKRLAAYVDPNHKSWWIGVGWYWLATFLLMTWPYRWLFRARTGNAKYKLVKHIYMDRPEVSSNIEYTMYNISEQDQTNLCKRASVAENPEANETDNKRISRTRFEFKKDKKAKKQAKKTDVDIKLGTTYPKMY